MRHPRESRGIKSSNDGKSFKVKSNHLDFQDITNDTVKHDFNIDEEVCSTNTGRKGKVGS